MYTPYRIVSLSAAALAATAIPASAQSPAAPAKLQVAPLFEYIFAKCGEFGWGFVALTFLATLSVGFFAAWLISKLLSRDTGTLFNTARYYLYGLLISGLILALAGGLCWFGISTGAAALALAAVALGSLAFLIISFVIPMKVYDIGFLKALVFNILVAIATGIGQSVLGTVLPGPLDELKGKTAEEQKKIVTEWHAKKREKELNTQFTTPPAAAPALTPIQRAQQMYAELQQERARLDLNDQPAVLAFNQRVAEYNALKAQFAPAPAAATPVPASPKGKK